MSGNRANLVKCKGLVTFGSELSVSEGSLRQAENVNVDENGVITPRRGFNDYALPTGGTETTSKITKQIFEYKDSIIRHYNDLLEYEDSNGVFQSINGTFDEVRTGYRTKWQEANSNMYFTSDEGIKKISVKTQDNLNADMVTDAGGPKAGYSSGVIVPTVGGFLPPESQVAYRVLYGTKDNNNNLILGAPSSRFIVTNYNADVVTPEESTITLTPEADLDIADGDYFMLSILNNKYTVYFDTTGSAASIPKTADNIGSIYVNVDVTGTVGSSAGDDELVAGILANTMAAEIPNITVTLDTNVVTVTNTEEGDITDISASKTVLGVSGTPTGIVTATVEDGNVDTGSSATVKITGVIPDGVTTDYFYQIYRTANITVSDGLTISDLDPGDEMNLVYEAGITAAQITANEFEHTDTTPESFRASAVPLYTNEVTGEGILQANDTPPIALDIELFRNYTFYANTKQKHNLEFSIISVDDLVSGSTKFVVGNSSISRYYTFTGTAEVTDLTVTGTPTAGDYFTLHSANDERQYYIYFGLVGDDPEVAGAIGYRVDITGSPSNDDMATRIETALADNVDVSLSVASNVVTFTHLNNGYTTGLTEVVDVGSDITISAPSTAGTGELSGEDEGGDVLLSGLTSVGQSIDETARSLVKVISKDPLSPVNAYYLSTSIDLPGNILLESKSLEDITFYIGIEESGNSAIGGEFTPELPYSKKIEEFTGATTLTNIKLTGHGYTTGDEIFIGIQEADYDNAVAYLSATPDIVEYSGNIYECILDSTGNLPSGDNTDNTYWQYISPEFSGVYPITNIDADNFSIIITTPTSTVSFVPTYSSIFSPDVESDNQEISNRIYYSKVNEPEAVPVSNFIDVGPQDEEIKRILALRDNLFVLKDDGIYVVSGTSAPNWSVRLIDSTRIIAPDSAVVLNNQIYALTEQGVTRIVDSGAGIISRGIENLIDDITNQGFDFSSNTFGVAYENDRSYIMFAPQNSTDTSATQAFRYNIFEQTWTRWEYEATCGHVMQRDSKLYLGNADRNYVSQERKNNDRTDHSDRNFSTAINSNGVSADDGLVIELSSLVDIEKNDVLVQTQDVTINYINNRLLNKMDLFDTGITPPVASTMYDSFKATDGDNLSDIMQAINDHLVTLDGVNISVKAFTLSTLRSLTEDLVNELNTVATITSIKTYKLPTTINYEAYIVSVDSLRNQVTLQAARPWVEGSIEVYKNIKKTIEWNPQHFGDPSALKQISYITIMFDQNNFNNAIAKFATDAAQSVKEVEFSGKGIGYWSDLPYDDPNSYWGGVGNDIPFRTPVPSGKQRCRYLSLTFEHINAREYFRILGISAVVRAVSSKAYR